MKYLFLLFLLSGCASQSDLVKLLVEEVNGYKQHAATFQGQLNQCQQQGQQLYAQMQAEKKKALTKNYQRRKIKVKKKKKVRLLNNVIGAAARNGSAGKWTCRVMNHRSGPRL